MNPAFFAAITAANVATQSAMARRRREARCAQKPEKKLNPTRRHNVHIARKIRSEELKEGR